MIYIASPFFNDEQNKTVSLIEDILLKRSLDYFSPRKSGVTLKDLPSDERQKVSKQVYDSNIKALRSSSLVIAYTDDFDPGTVWEIGYATSRNLPIATFSTNNYGGNVMISQSSLIHFSNLELVEDFFSRISWGGSYNRRTWKTFLRKHSEFCNSELKLETTT